MFKSFNLFITRFKQEFQQIESVNFQIYILYTNKVGR